MVPGESMNLQKREFGNLLAENGLEYYRLIFIFDLLERLDMWKCSDLCSDVTPQRGLPAPPLTTAHPTPALYPLTLLHLSPCFLRSPHDLYLQLSVSLMSVYPEKVATTRAGPWSVCSPLCSRPWSVPGSASGLSRHWGSE